MRPVSETERGWRRYVSLAQRHAFEMFSHLTGQSKCFDLPRQFELLFERQRRESPHFRIETATHQELGLCGKTGHLESSCYGRGRDSREVDPRRQILDAGQNQWVVVCVMPEMASQPPVRPLLGVVLTARYAVIEQENSAFLQRD